MIVSGFPVCCIGVDVLRWGCLSASLFMAQLENCGEFQGITSGVLSGWIDTLRAAGDDGQQMSEFFETAIRRQHELSDGMLSFIQVVLWLFVILISIVSAVITVFIVIAVALARKMWSHATEQSERAVNELKRLREAQGEMESVLDRFREFDLELAKVRAEFIVPTLELQVAHCHTIIKSGTFQEREHALQRLLGMKNYYCYPAFLECLRDPSNPVSMRELALKEGLGAFSHDITHDVNVVEALLVSWKDCEPAIRRAAKSVISSMRPDKRPFRNQLESISRNGHANKLIQEAATELLEVVARKYS